MPCAKNARVRIFCYATAEQNCFAYHIKHHYILTKRFGVSYMLHKQIFPVSTSTHDYVSCLVCTGQKQVLHRHENKSATHHERMSGEMSKRCRNSWDSLLPSEYDARRGSQALLIQHVSLSTCTQALTTSSVARKMSQSFQNYRPFTL